MKSTKRSILFTMCFVIVAVALWSVFVRQTHSRTDKYRTEPGYSAQSSVQLARSVEGLDYQDFVSAAISIFKKKGVVFFAMINDAYYEMTASWCCNTASFGVHEHVLFLTTDQATGRQLKSLWPNIVVVSMNGSRFMGAQQYSRAGHVRMMTERTRAILHLLEAGIRVLVFEVDCLWLSNPLPDLLSRQGKEDMQVTRVAGTDATASGFLLMNPTTATVKLWQSLTRSMEDLGNRLKNKNDFDPVSESLNEQQFLSALINKRFAGIKLLYLPDNLFPDGKWYQMSETVRSAKPRPLIINNNWIVGNAAKIRRAKTFGHWFLNDNGGTCNTTALHNLNL